MYNACHSTTIINVLSIIVSPQAMIYFCFSPFDMLLIWKFQFRDIWQCYIWHNSVVMSYLSISVSLLPDKGALACQLCYEGYTFMGGICESQCLVGFYAASQVTQLVCYFFYKECFCLHSTNLSHLPLEKWITYYSYCCSLARLLCKSWSSIVGDIMCESDTQSAV